jgi:hypothetical protein
VLHRKILRNAVPRVRSRSIDATVTAALAMPSAAALLTHDALKNLQNEQVAVDTSRDADTPVAIALNVTLVGDRIPPRVVRTSYSYKAEAK